MRGGQRLAVVEAYFPLEGRAVFARFMLEVPLGFGAPQAPQPGQENGPGDEMQAVLSRKLEDASLVLASIRPLR